MSNGTTITPKTWTAEDIDADKVQLWLDDDGDLRIERHYRFVDARGDKLPIAGSLLSESVPWADVPADIQSALVAINDWTRQKILEQEGMV